MQPALHLLHAGGGPGLAAPKLLTDDEIVRLVRVAVERLGVTEVRFTGGEPLIRRGLVDIVAAAAALRPRPRLSLTTNGIGLDRLAGRCGRRAGPGERLAGHPGPRPGSPAHPPRPARRGAAGLRGAAAAGLSPVKINTVLMRGVNDDEAPALLRFALDHGYQLRFIEQMPLDAQHGWDRDKMVTAEEILAVAGAVRSAARPGLARGGAGGDLAGRRVHRRGRRAGAGRRDRQRDPAVLRRLRPHPAHRGRSGAQLPLRHGGDRPARAAARRRRRRARSPRPGAWRCGANGPVTASTTRPSCSRPGRCPRSAGLSDRTLTVRYFAGARAAAGAVERGGPAPVARRTTQLLSDRHGERLAVVLKVASFLVDG